MKKFFEIHSVKGVAGGFVYENKTLEFAILLVVVQLHFEVITNGLQRFWDCLKEN